MWNSLGGGVISRNGFFDVIIKLFHIKTLKNMKELNDLGCSSLENC